MGIYGPAIGTIIGAFLHFFIQAPLLKKSGFKFFAKKEGIIAALESSHALSEAIKVAKEIGKNKNIIVNVSGRGDKDIFITAKALSDEKWIAFLKEEIQRYEQNR